MLPDQLSAAPDDLVIVVRGTTDEVVASALDAAENVPHHGRVGPSPGRAGRRDDRRGHRRHERRGPRAPGDDGHDLDPGQLRRRRRRACAPRRPACVLLLRQRADLDDEVRVKRIARDRRLLHMGPDCGTAIIDGIPFGFANVVRRGPVGIVAASGTGAQEVSRLLDLAGAGVSQLIGVGGRDLSPEVDGLMTDLALDLLEADPETEVIVVVSKPPADAVAKRLLARLAAIAKTGTRRSRASSAPTTPTRTSSCAARSRAALSPRPLPPVTNWTSTGAVHHPRAAPPGRMLGLYTGGTLASEAKLLLKRAGVDGRRGARPRRRRVHGRQAAPDDRSRGAGRRGSRPPAPMPTVGILLLDVVLGYGSSPDPATPVVDGGDRGTNDRRRRRARVARHRLGVRHAGRPAGTRQTDRPARPARASCSRRPTRPPRDSLRLTRDRGDAHDRRRTPHRQRGPAPHRRGGPAADVVQLDWRPPGIRRRRRCPTRAAARRRRDRRREPRPRSSSCTRPGRCVTGIRPAAEVVPGIADGRTLLHAGPPIEFERMCGPMRGALIGATHLRGLGRRRRRRHALLSRGAITLDPCHHHDAVGPMAGVLSPSMPVFVAEESTGTSGRRAYASLNEGLGKVLRFGAYDSEVLDRLAWMRDVLGPTVNAAIEASGPDRHHVADQPGARDGRRGPQSQPGLDVAARASTRPVHRRASRRDGDRVDPELSRRQRPLRPQHLDGGRQARHGRGGRGRELHPRDDDGAQRRRVRAAGGGDRRRVVHDPGRSRRRAVLPGLRARRREPRPRRLGDHRDPRARRVRDGGISRHHPIRRRNAGRRSRGHTVDATDHARAASRVPAAAP